MHLLAANMCVWFVTAVTETSEDFRQQDYNYRLTHNRKDSRFQGARCSSVVRAFAHGAMGRRIDPSWGGPIELFLVPASAPYLKKENINIL